MAHLIGLDVGGTKIAGALYADDGATLAEATVATPDSYGTFLDACAAVARRVQGDAACPVGVGIAGRIDHAAGSVGGAPNMPFLAGRSFRDDLGAKLGREIRFANDANCAALAEAVDGAGAGCDSVLGLILGTGVGSGFVCGGRLLDGPNGLTGEIGHLPLPFREAADGPVVACGCGQQGCIEKSISGGALARLYETMTGACADARMIGERALAGDAEALRVLDRYFEIVAKAMVAVLHSFDPEIIVVSGGLNALPALYDEVPKRWGRYCYASNPKTKFVPAKHGPTSGTRGAAWLWRR